jgi:hypothetical protein
MTCVEKRGIFLGGWLFAVWEGRVGMGKKRRNRGGEGRQSGDILTFADRITDGRLLSVFLMVNWTRQSTEISIQIPRSFCW